MNARRKYQSVPVGITSRWTLMHVSDHWARDALKDQTISRYTEAAHHSSTWRSKAWTQHTEFSIHFPNLLRMTTRQMMQRSFQFENTIRIRLANVGFGETQSFKLDRLSGLPDGSWSRMLASFHRSVMVSLRRDDVPMVG